LYKAAKALSATKIALGHHRDDMLETLFLNMFYGGRLKSMPPKLVSDNGEHTVIRPLAYCNEADIESYSQQMDFPIIPCNLCGSQENLQRKNIKMMLQDWQKRFPGRIESMAKSLQNVVPSHLADKALFDFKEMSVVSDANVEGDTAFDQPSFAQETPASSTQSDITIVELK
jgi:tRNA 2-thiocytidine biosynthesis protein TtcA